jgi:hypothetical protein
VDSADKTFAVWFCGLGLVIWFLKNQYFSFVILLFMDNMIYTFQTLKFKDGVKALLKNIEKVCV